MDEQKTNEKTKEYNRYENSKVYKLIEPNSGFFYIGSTCDTLSKRFGRHKTTAKTKPDIKVYKCFNEIGWENVKIVLIQELYLENKEQLLRAENDVIEANVHDEKCLNSSLAWTGLDRKEYNKKYFIDHREQIKSLNIEYHCKHKSERNEYSIKKDYVSLIEIDMKLDEKRYYDKVPKSIHVSVVGQSRWEINQSMKG